MNTPTLFIRRGLRAAALALLGATASQAGSHSLAHQWAHDHGNLIPNWSFENRFEVWSDATVNGMTSTARLSQAGISPSGNFVGLVSGTTSAATEAMLLRTPPISLRPGQTYTLSFYVRADGTISSGSTPTIVFTYDKSNIISTSSGNSYANFATSVNGTSVLPDWTLYRHEFTVGTATGSLAEIALWRSTAYGVSGTLYFDDVILEEGSVSASDIQARHQRRAYSVSFLDGQGRERQSLSRTLDDHELYRVQGTELDSAARPFRSPLPFTTGMALPTFQSDALGSANGYHGSAGGYAYDEVQYAPDPTGRILKSASVGYDWRIDGTKVRESGFYFVADSSVIPSNVKAPSTDNNERAYRLDWSRDEDSAFTLAWTNRKGQVVQSARSDEGGQWAVTRMEYHPNGQLRRTLTPLDVASGTTEFAQITNYNAQGLLTSSFSPDRGLEKFWYNREGSLRFRQDDLQYSAGYNLSTYFDYDDFGNLISTGQQTPYNFDQANIVDGNGESYPYGKVEAKGFLYGSLRDFEARTGIPLDSLDPILETLPQREGALMAAWNLNPESKAPGLTNQDKLVADFYRYNGRGLVQRQMRYMGALGENKFQSVEMTYDTLGRLAASAHREVLGSYAPFMSQEYSYDALGRVRAVTGYGSDTIARYAYDELGDLTQVWLGEESQGYGTEMRYGYHFKGWRKDVEAFSLWDSRTIFRQMLGFEDRALDESGVPSLIRPSHTGRITQQLYRYLWDVPDPLRVVNYRYDALGRMTEAAYQHNGGSFSYGGDLEFPLSFNDVDALDTRVAYDRNGRIMGKRSGGVAPEDSAMYGYHSGSYRLASVSGKLNAAGRDASGYENFGYDAVGRMTGDRSKGLTIEYDHDGMPVEFRMAGGRELSLYPLYDAGGQRTSQIAVPHLPTSFPGYWIGTQEGWQEEGLYTAPDIGSAWGDAYYQLNFMNVNLPDTVFFYVIANDGEDTVSVSYLAPLNRGGNFIPVVVRGVRKYTVAYDSLLAARTGGKASAQHYVLLGGQVTGEVREAYDAGGSVVDRDAIAAVFGRGVPIGRYVNGDHQFYVKNHLGSTVRVVNADGSYDASPVFDYQAYGEAQVLREDSLHRVGPKYTGKDLDTASNLYYFGARWYDQELGMWMSPDPVSQYFNPYGYGYGDPLNGVDPNGMVWAVFRPSKWENFGNDALRKTGNVAKKFDRWAGGYGEYGDRPDDNIFRQMYRSFVHGQGGACVDGSRDSCTEGSRGVSVQLGGSADQNGDWTFSAGGHPPIGPGTEIVKKNLHPEEAAAADAVVVSAESRVVDPCANSSSGCIYATPWYSEYVYYSTQAYSSPPVQLAMWLAPIPTKGLGFIDDAGRGIQAVINVAGRPRSLDRALPLAERFLGHGYKEIAPGVYRSSDGMRQFRMTESDLMGRGMKGRSHVHYEWFDSKGEPLRNYHVPLVPPY